MTWRRSAVSSRPSEPSPRPATVGTRPTTPCSPTSSSSTAPPGSSGSTRPSRGTPSSRSSLSPGARWRARRSTTRSRWRPTSSISSRRTGAGIAAGVRSSRRMPPAYSGFPERTRPRFAERHSCTTSARVRCRTRSGTSPARSRARSSTASSFTRCSPSRCSAARRPSPP